MEHMCVGSDECGLTATIVLTEQSNYTGRLCRGTGCDGTYPIEGWITLIKDLVQNRGCTCIRFSGGEPLLYPWLSDLVSFAKDMGAETCVCTNGSLADREFLDRNIGFLDRIELTVCSSEESTEISMGRHAQGVDHVKRTVKTARKAAERGMGVTLYVPVTRKCLGDDFSGIASRSRADRVVFIRMDEDTGLADTARYAVTDREFDAFLDRNSSVENSEVYGRRGEEIIIAPDGRVVTEGAEGRITVSYKRYWKEGSDFEDLKTDIRESSFYRNTLRPFFDRFRSYMTEV